MISGRDVSGCASLIVLAWLLVAGSASASLANEASQRQTAKGEVAFQQGRYEVALAYFELAVAADPSDATAQYDRGLALGRLDRWDEAEAAFEQALTLRPDFEEARRGRDLAREAARGKEETLAAAGPAVRRWGVYAGTGVQYDTNVTLTPQGEVAQDFPGGQADVGFLFSAGGRYDLVERPEALVRLEYDFYQVVHPDLDDFNFRSNRVRGTGSYRLLPELWAGLQGGYNYYTLGSQTYLGEPFISPFVSILEDPWGVTQVQYRHGWDTYFSTPFNGVRDGPNDTAGINQTFFLSEDRYLQVGYVFRSERPHETGAPAPRPDLAVPGDFAMRAHQAYIGFGFLAWWQTSVDLMYLYRLENYTQPNSIADPPFSKRRHDYQNQGYVSLSRPINEWVRVIVDWYGTLNGSNIPDFKYHRNVVSAFVEVRY